VALSAADGSKRHVDPPAGKGDRRLDGGEFDSGSGGCGQGRGAYQHTWLHQPAFLAAYHRARADAVSQAIGTLQRISHSAVVALGRVLVNRETPPAVVVQAANVILNYATRGTVDAEVQRRLAELEHATAHPPVESAEDEPVVSENGHHASEH